MQLTMHVRLRKIGKAAERGCIGPHLHVEEAGASVGPANGEGVSVVGILQQCSISHQVCDRTKTVHPVSCHNHTQYMHAVQKDGTRHSIMYQGTCSASRYMVCPKMGRLLRRKLLLSPCRRSWFSLCTATCMRMLSG